MLFYTKRVVVSIFYFCFLFILIFLNCSISCNVIPSILFWNPSSSWETLRRPAAWYPTSKHYMGKLHLFAIVPHWKYSWEFRSYLILGNLSSLAGALSFVSMASQNQKHKRRLGDSMFLGTPKRASFIICQMIISVFHWRLILIAAYCLKISLYCILQLLKM